MGGVINIITRKVPSEWGGEIRMDSTIQESSKSGDIYQGNFYLAGPIKNDLLGLQIYGRATQRDEDNIYDGFRKRNTNSVTAKLALTPNRDHDIVLEATTARQKIQNTLGKTVAPLAPGERRARAARPRPRPTTAATSGRCRTPAAGAGACRTVMCSRKSSTTARGR